MLTMVTAMAVVPAHSYRDGTAQQISNSGINLEILEKLERSLERRRQLLGDAGVVCQSQLQSSRVLAILLVDFLDDRKLEVVGLK